MRLRADECPISNSDHNADCTERRTYCRTNNASASFCRSFHFVTNGIASGLYARPVDCVTNTIVESNRQPHVGRTHSKHIEPHECQPHRHTHHARPNFGSNDSGSDPPTVRGNTDGLPWAVHGTGRHCVRHAAKSVPLPVRAVSRYAWPNHCGTFHDNRTTHCRQRQRRQWRWQQ